MTLKRASRPSRRAAVCIALILCACRSLASQPPKGPALTSVRRVGLEVVVKDDVAGSVSSELRRSTLRAQVEQWLLCEGVATDDEARTRLSIVLRSPNDCETPAKSTGVVHLWVRLLDDVIVQRNGRDVQTVGVLWSTSDVEICSADKTAASRRMLGVAINEFLRRIGVDTTDEDGCD